MDGWRERGRDSRRKGGRDEWMDGWRDRDKGRKGGRDEWMVG